MPSVRLSTLRSISFPASVASPRENASRLNVSLPNGWGPPAPTFSDGRSTFSIASGEDDAKSAVHEMLLRAAARARRASRCLVKRAFDRADADIWQTKRAEAKTGPV